MLPGGSTWDEPDILYRTGCAVIYGNLFYWQSDGDRYRGCLNSNETRGIKKRHGLQRIAVTAIIGLRQYRRRVMAKDISHVFLTCINDFYVEVEGVGGCGCGCVGTLGINDTHQHGELH